MHLFSNNRLEIQSNPDEICISNVFVAESYLSNNIERKINIRLRKSSLLIKLSQRKHLTGMILKPLCTNSMFKLILSTRADEHPIKLI